MLLNQWGQPVAAMPQSEVLALARQAQAESGELQRLARDRRDHDDLFNAFGLSENAGNAAYQTGEPLRHQLPQDPRFRPFSPLSVDVLRTLARSNDVAARCISHLKSEVVKIPLKVALKDEKDKSPASKRALVEANAWLNEEGGIGGEGVGRDIFEAQMIDDLCIVGATALVLEFATRGDRLDGIPSQVRCIDAATIQPLVTPYGFPVGNDAPAFLQWVQGIPVGRFTRSELIYSGLSSFARSDSPYFMSPTEDAAIQLYTLMSVDEWNRSWLKHGSGYRRWLKLNPDVTPSQAKDWMEIMTIQTKGNAEERHGIGVAPGEITGDESRRDQDFDGYETKRITRICSSYGVNPASIGYHGEEHKDDQEAAIGSTKGGIVGELLGFREKLYNRLLRQRGWGFLVVTEDIPAPAETAKERDERQAASIAGGVKTVNQVRKENGDDAIEGGNELLLPGTLKPLSQIIAPPPVPEIPGTPGDPTEGDPTENAPKTAKNPVDAATGAKTPDISRAEIASGETATQHEFSCVMAFLGEDAADMVRNFARTLIAPEDLTQEDGFETEPHITLRYGLHTADPEEVAQVLVGHSLIRAKVLGVSIFEGAKTGRDFDVVKLDVEGHDGDLDDVHARLGELEHTDSHSTYQPHITLAYVKAGTGAKYAGEFPFWKGGLSDWLEFGGVRFSSKTGEATAIDLASGHQRAIERVLGQWERKSLKRLESGRSAACAFESELLFDATVQSIYGELAAATTKSEVREVFEVARMAKRAKTSEDPHNNAGSFASFWGGSERDATTAAHFNGQNITVEFNDKEEVQKRVMALFPQPLSESDFKHLAGAPDGATVKISPHPREKDSVVVMVDHPLLVPWSHDKGGAVQTLEMGRVNGQANIFYDALSTTGQVRGFGARMMGYTIEAARALGVGSITLHAAGKVGDKEFSGWKAWARMGFEAAIPPAVQEKQRSMPNLSPHVRSAGSIAELHGTSEGQEFWKQHGESFVGNFDLNLKSFAGKRSEAVKQAFFDQFKIKLS